MIGIMLTIGFLLKLLMTTSNHLLKLPVYRDAFVSSHISTTVSPLNDILPMNEDNSPKEWNVVKPALNSKNNFDLISFVG